MTLRFKPEHAQRWKEHWIYDLDAPGAGLTRTAFSFDVSVLRPEASSSALRYRVRRQFHGQGQGQGGRAQPWLDVNGAQLRSSWGPDRSLLGDFTVEAPLPAAADALRELVLAARFGMLIEYPDQAISVGDSWSIEPRTLTVGPGLAAILRPSYSLESISHETAASEAIIGADIQVDLIPEVLGDGVMVEGGGTASGSLRVRASDGVLLEARTILHFNQEVRVQGTETLGYREFAAHMRIVATRSQAQPDLSAESLPIEPLDPDEARACSGLLEVAVQRVGYAVMPLRPNVLVALSSDVLPALPMTDAREASAIREPGNTLWLAADGKRIELDGSAVELKELSRAVRILPLKAAPLYVLAPASLSVDKLRSTLAQLPRRSDVRLLVRVGDHDATAPRATRFVEEQLRQALLAADDERPARLHQLLVEHLVLCEGALDVFRTFEKDKLGASETPALILREVAKCGCTTTQVDGLELTLQALFGSQALRAIPVREGWTGGVAGFVPVQTLLSSHAR